MTGLLLCTTQYKGRGGKATMEPAQEIDVKFGAGKMGVPEGVEQKSRRLEPAAFAHTHNFGGMFRLFRQGFLLGTR
eukprot:2203869-Rhodomonas_salina.1